MARIFVTRRRISDRKLGPGGDRRQDIEINSLDVTIFGAGIAIETVIEFVSRSRNGPA
jgi:hypothetical protein